MEQTLTADTPANRLPCAVLITGLALGFLADQLFGRTGPVGLGFTLWSLLFVCGFMVLQDFPRLQPTRQVAAWSAVAAAAAAVILLRTTPILVLALLLNMVVAVAMIYLHLDGRSLAESTLSDHLRAVLRVPINGLLGAFPVLTRIDLEGSARSPKLRTYLRGILLTLPLLLLFGSLFSAADAGFDRLFSRLVDLLSDNIVEHLALSLALAWLSTGLLARAAGEQTAIQSQPLQWLRLGSEDTAIIMGSLAALFLVFVVLQLGYLFGGQETIEATSGLTLAAYARRGFFELLVVTGFTLAVLVIVARSGCNERVFRPLAIVLLVCVLIILFSAVQRLLLYIDGFGLTIDRLVALAVMAWLATGLLLFASTLLRGKTRVFAAGMTTSGVLIVFLLALANPAAVVARVNIERTATNQQPLDINYLLRLGTDAVPALIKNFESITSDQRCGPIFNLFMTWYRHDQPGFQSADDWRGWNYSRSRASTLISGYEERLKSLADGCVVGSNLLGVEGPGWPLYSFGRNGALDMRMLQQWLES